MNYGLQQYVIENVVRISFAAKDRRNHHGGLSAEYAELCSGCAARSFLQRRGALEDDVFPRDFPRRGRNSWRAYLVNPLI